MPNKPLTTLVFDFFCSILFSMGGGGCTWEKKIALSLKRHRFPHGDRVKMPAQAFLDLIFDAAPHLEYLFQFFFARH